MFSVAQWAIAQKHKEATLKRKKKKTLVMLVIVKNKNKIENWYSADVDNLAEERGDNFGGWIF